MRKILLLISCFCLFFSCKNNEDAPIILDKQILQHPRLLYTAFEEKNVQSLIGSEPLMADMQVSLFKEAEKLLTAPLQEYTLRDVNYVQDILMISREQVFRMFTLALAYRLSDDKRYLRKVEEELVTVCNYPNWNPRHLPMNIFCQN